MADFDKNGYWKKRMESKTISFLKTLDPFEKEIRDMYGRSVDIDRTPVISAFQKIGLGFGELLRVIRGDPGRDEEGIVDLSRIAGK